MANNGFTLLSEFSSIGIALVLFFAMIVVYLAGSRILANRKDSETSGGLGPVEGSFLGLLALLLAFTFGISSSRYDTRRQIVVEEANDIGTAILRADLYAESERKLFRADFADYVEARISFYEAGLDKEKVVAADQLSADISAKLWKRAATLAQNRDSLIPSSQMIPALNNMIDIVTTRNAAGLATVPDSILWMLFALCLLSSFTVGYRQEKARSSLVVVIVLLSTLSASIFLILDLDRPRQGLINLDNANRNIIALRKMFENTQ